MKKIKLIWDFRGPMAKGTAHHHVVHLKEFAQREGISNSDFGDEGLSEMHHIAFMVVDESDMIKVRDALKPHRGEIA